MNKPMAWSYSALTAFETCAHRFYETRIAKSIVEPQTEHTLWGNRVHKAFEYRIAHGTPFDAELKQFEPIAAKIVAQQQDGKRVSCEQKLALNKDLIGRKWFDKDVWVRGIIDVSIEHGDKMFIGDFKTGRPTPDSAQLKLTAAMSFAIKPYINRITNTFIWLKTGGATTEKFERGDVAGIWQEFAPRISRMQQAYDADAWPKRPSGLCGWCPVKSCEHWRDRNGRK